MLGDVPMRFSEAGLLFPLYEHPLLTPPPVWIAYALYGLMMLSFLLITIGAWMRTGTVIAFILYAYYQGLSLHMFGASFDKLFQLILLVLTFSGADCVFSYKMKKRYGSALEWEHISVLPQRIIALQIAFIYLGVGFQKLWLPSWKTGEVLYYAFIGRWGTPVAYSIAETVPMIYFDWMVYITKAFELMIPFGLFIKPIQKWFFFGGAIFHTIMTIFLGIWWFMILIPSYILFLEPEVVQKWWELRRTR